MQKVALLILLFIVASIAAVSRPGRHTFVLGEHDFVLDGKPFQIISGELHPARIPPEYWRHRIRMARAMGCNTVAAYIFWNYHEHEPGRFDFTTENRDIAQFIRIIQEEGMFVLLRPGPYVCAEWDFGGLPPYLLRIPDIKVRCTDLRYMDAVGRYIGHLANLIRPLLVTNGVFFKGTFELKDVADTYIDVSNYVKGFVWVNGHNLGRYWNIGPQTRLYCPAPWLTRGRNEILLLDMHCNEPGPLRGMKTLE